MAKKIKLGNEYRDKVTGFTGTATAKTEYLNGCVQFILESKVKPEAPGEKPNSIWVDEQQLEEVKANPAPAQRRTGGGVRPTPPR